MQTVQIYKKSTISKRRINNKMQSTLNENQETIVILYRPCADKEGGMGSGPPPWKIAKTKVFLAILVRIP